MTTETATETETSSVPKMALCFLLSYEHVLHKETLWREWIEPNKDIINVYVYYKHYHKIGSPWVRQYALPPSWIYPTDYFHVIPAYVSLMKFALNHDANNQWVCMLTDACCPLMSSARWREMFHQHSHTSLFRWKKAWWNPLFHKRANLKYLPEECRLGHDPWFVMKRSHVETCLSFFQRQPNWTQFICDGGLANESLFAVALYMSNKLTKEDVLNVSSHLTDWKKRSSATSPRVFVGTPDDIRYIREAVSNHPMALFVRKIAPSFSDDIFREIWRAQEGH